MWKEVIKFIINVKNRRNTWAQHLRVWKWIRKVDNYFSGVLGVFLEATLDVSEENNDFTEKDAEINNDKILHEDIIKSIENNEAIPATDASAKEGHVREFLKIADGFHLA